MIFTFEPWELDIDVEATKQLYQENDYSVDKEANEEFEKLLTDEQAEFFHSLGISLEKITVDKKIYDIPEDDGMSAAKIDRIMVNFLMCGKFIALPEFQKELYSDEEIFGKEFPETIRVKETEEGLPVYEIGLGVGIVFKHPVLYFEKKKFQRWDCGYILGSLLIMTEK